MKNLWVFLLCIGLMFGIGFGSGPAEGKDSGPEKTSKGDISLKTFKVMSYNIRLIAPADKENEWKYRKEALVSEIRATDPLLLGVQEATWPQMEFLAKELSDYAWIGAGRDDGKQKGEFSAVFYKKAFLKILDSGTFWLSESPEKAGSLGWDAACRRVVSWGKFEFANGKKSMKEYRDLQGKKFVYANTHFDHIGKIARKNSALLIVEQLDKLSENLPVAVSGDFNARSDSEVYSLLVEKKANDRGWRDTFAVAKKKDLQHQGTFHNYGKLPEKERPRIDYIFINKGFGADLFRICGDQRNGRFTSDHVPITAEIYFADAP
ncbi:MAG: endonuclease/exonuclease/phosphatase family protein [Planctomycetia bacterium]|nr:endonuclease/exonuclease/phosphatase family protein [Planctomycetia bacterium]